MRTNISTFRKIVEDELTKRNRKENDFDVQKKKLVSKIIGYQDEIDNMLNKIAIMAESTSAFR